MSPPSVVETSVGKSKSIGITLRSNGSMQTAKEKLKAPCEYECNGTRVFGNGSITAPGVCVVALDGKRKWESRLRDSGGSVGQTQAR